MLIFMSLGIHFWTVFHNSFVQYFQNVLLKYRKESNIVCFSYIVGGVRLDKNISDLWSL